MHSAPASRAGREVCPTAKILGAQHGQRPETSASMQQPAQHLQIQIILQINVHRFSPQNGSLFTHAGRPGVLAALPAPGSTERQGCG